MSKSMLIKSGFGNKIIIDILFYKKVNIVSHTKGRSPALLHLSDLSFNFVLDFYLLNKRLKSWL